MAESKKGMLIVAAICSVGLLVLGLSSCSNPTLDDEESLSSNADLSDLTLDTGTLNETFASSTTDYTANVDYTVDEITVTGTSDDADAFVHYYPAQTSPLDVGDNAIIIVVIAEDGTTIKDYTVTVTREPKNDNADLSDLTLDTVTLNEPFTSSTTEYTADVDNTVGEITVTGTSDDADATVDYSPAQTSSLYVGANEITITVTAEDGTTTKDYTVTVTREITTSYEIRDTGPAGGIIFYKDTENNYPWTYLEAAPVSTEWTDKKWGADRTEIGDNVQLTWIGYGQPATDAIVQYLDNNTYETGRAAQLCDALEHDHDGTTYSDWFLPSKDELDKMYVNLHQAGVGGFADDIYWSSTEYDEDNSDLLAWMRNFLTSTQIGSPKSGGLRVRAVRAF